MKKLAFLIIVGIMGFSPVLKAQQFGFGCLGLSGVFGGYSYQFYKADGLNDYINSIATSTGHNVNFNKGEGFIIGANIFRAQFHSVFIGLKGFYQFLEETKTIIPLDDNTPSSYQFNLNYWGAGIDFGFPLGSFISFKLIDAGVTYSDISLKISQKFNGENIPVMKYTSVKPKIGYYVGSGLLFNLISNYVSLELTARYHFTNYDNLQNENNQYLLQQNSNVKLVSLSGIQASAQLNIGISF